MYICPLTGSRLRRARAKGGIFYYSPESHGRMLPMAMVRHYLGKHEAQEIWMRSENAPADRDKRCPGCLRAMKVIKEPKWIGDHELDVCRVCHVVWLDPGEHEREVPHHTDIDSGVVEAEQEAAQRQVELDQVKHDDEKKKLFGEGPEELHKKIFGFIGLPSEMGDRNEPQWPVVTVCLFLGMLVIHFLWGRQAGLIEEFGFYPDEMFKNSGFNIIASGFLHTGWSHLLSNMYFFFVFADDVEEDLGHLGLFLLILGCLIVTAILKSVAATHGDIPHVGASGYIMAIMVYYGLRFPDQRFAYLVPAFHTFNLGAGQYTWLRTLRWLRVKALWVVVGFVLLDVLRYFVMERSLDVATVSYSSHLIGALVGFLFWVAFGYKDTQQEIRYKEI